MKLSINDSLLILAVEANPATYEAVKTAYRKACSKYHPDRNPAGTEMMKAVNVADQTLVEHFENVDEIHNNGTEKTASYTGEKDFYDYGDKLNEALNSIINLDGLKIEVCGAWVWVTGETKAHKDILKTNGFYYASKKQAWYFRPVEFKSSNRKEFTLDQIRDKYGSSRAKASGRALLS